MIDGHESKRNKHSFEVVFNPKHVANVLLKAVQDFNPAKGTNLKPNGLMSKQPGELCALVEELCDKVALIIEQESKCQPVGGPCYIIGDIHGNLEDLLSLEKAFWPNIPCVRSHYLFLGDYVDRGRWSVGKCNSFTQ